MLNIAKLRKREHRRPYCFHLTFVSNFCMMRHRICIIFSDAYTSATILLHWFRAYCSWQPQCEQNVERLWAEPYCICIFINSVFFFFLFSFIFHCRVNQLPAPSFTRNEEIIFEEPSVWWDYGVRRLHLIKTSSILFFLARVRDVVFLDAPQLMLIQNG